MRPNSIVRRPTPLCSQRLDAALLLALVALASPGLALAQNLFPDPTFSSGVSGWTTSPNLPSRLDWNGGSGADGSPGFARLTGLVGGPGGFAAKICLPVHGGATYSWGGYLHFSQVTPGEAYFNILFFADSACGGPADSPLAQSQVVFGGMANPQTWYLSPGPDFVAPAAASSVEFIAQLLIGIPSPPQISVDFDNVYFGPQGTQPPAIAVVPTLSVSALVLLAVALAVAGIRCLGAR